VENSHAANVSFCLRVMPPSAVFGLSLQAQSQRVAASWPSSIDPNNVCDSQS
jgi:hypothetical protein